MITKDNSANIKLAETFRNQHDKSRNDWINNFHSALEVTKKRLIDKLEDHITVEPITLKIDNNEQNVQKVQPDVMPAPLFQRKRNKIIKFGAENLKGLKSEADTVSRLDFITDAKNEQLKWRLLYEWK